MPNAVKITRNVHRPDRAKQVMATQPAQVRRLAGALAAAETIAISAEAFERINVEEYSKIGVLFASTAGGQGTTTLDIFPMDAEASQDDGDTSVRLTAAAASQDTLDAANAEQAYTTLDVTEFKYVEVAVGAGAVGGDNVDIAFVDIFLA